MHNSSDRHLKNVFAGGMDLQEAGKVLIMVHGRGGSARDILGLADHLEVKDFALLAPQATHQTWYPYSFMVPRVQNEPWLSSALDILKETVADVTDRKIPSTHIYFLGFSQGACLTLEFVARNALPYGGVVAFTGGLIGEKISPENYTGDFQETPIFLGSSHPDPHVPVERVRATTAILKAMHAEVTTEIYDNMGHTISQAEIDLANALIFAPRV